MVTFLITVFAILVISGIGLYFWRKPTPRNYENILPPPPNARGLFADDPSANAFEKEQLAIAARERAEELIARARSGEKSVLEEAHRIDDAGLYDQALTELVRGADSNPKLLSLMSHVAQHELPVNRSLASAVIEAWHKAPDRSLTAKVLHFAALSDDASLYQSTVESALRLWREGKMPDVPAVELGALFDGEFWVLSSRSRSSGAGFIVKRTLASARRELEAAARANQ